MKYKYGDKVIIYGLNDKRGYDGKVGVILERDAIHNLWIVNVDGVRLGVHEENLKSHLDGKEYIVNLLKNRKSCLQREIKYAKYMKKSYLELFEEDESEREHYKDDLQRTQENIEEYNKEIEFINGLLPYYNSL